MSDHRIESIEEFNRYSIAVRDFESAQRYLRSARAHDVSSTEYEALLFTAIVAYYRPFSRNEQQKSVKAMERLSIENFGILTDS